MTANEKKPPHDVPPATLFVKVFRDHTNVRYVLSVVDRMGEGYPKLLDRDEYGTFDTRTEAIRVAGWVVDRLRGMGHTATVMTD